MQTIKKFTFDRIYSSPSSLNSYTLLGRNGHYLTFLATENGKRCGSWKTDATSTFKADADGAFESVLLSD
ncbi:MAG: hypothetical protein J6037_01175, partial [Bacteroidales bacterium]|nr:hypothetical protein [Bacteroidales bacterium]